MPPGPIPQRRTASPLAAFLDGWREVLRAPAVLVGTWLVWWGAWQLVSAPSAERLAAGVYTGHGAWLELIRAWLERLSDGFAPELAPFMVPAGGDAPIPSPLIVQTALLVFLTGGILDRYARARPIRTAAFFAACGVYFVRFLRLAVLVAAVIFVLSRIELALPSPLWGEIVALGSIVLLGILVDFAQVRAVVEDRHSMIGALAAAIRFIRRRAWRVGGLALLNGAAVLTLAATIGRLGQLAPASTAVWFTMAASLAHIAVRLACRASEVVFFQHELAHAGYTAAPLPLWPDSPAVEAMQNLVDRRDRLKTRN